MVASNPKPFARFGGKVPTFERSDTRTQAGQRGEFKASSQLDPNQFQSALEFQTEVRIRLLRIFSQPDYRPPVLPVIAVELVRLSQKPNTSLSDIVKVLERDPVLAADVLRVAQSAAFSGRTEVRSIQEAVNRVGLNRAADLFLRVALEAKIFRAPGYSEPLERLRQHSIATAELARLIGARVRQVNEYGYVCGLLHDIGIAGALIALAADDSGVRGVKFDAIWPALSSVHAQFTVQMAQLWNLPEELRATLRYHHTFAALQEPSDIAAATVLAEIMADGIGYGFQSEQADCMIDRATEVLQLTAGDLESIEREASKTLKDALH